MNAVSRTVGLTAIAMMAFAANSVLCRAALLHTSIDPASFTSIRLLAGVLVLCIFAYLNKKGSSSASEIGGDWLSAFSLFVYAAAFSFAYIQLTTATGALLLFGSVQLTMLSYGFFKGERLASSQGIGLLFAFAGMVILLLPGLTTPPLSAAALMILSGLAWGMYSIKGKLSVDPIGTSFGNFYRALLPAVVLSLLFYSQMNLDLEGVGYAVISGGLASGLGYVLWYAVLPSLSSVSAASVQLSVPVLAGLAGMLFLGELISLRLILCSIAVIGGIAVVIIYGQESSRSITTE